MNKARAINRVTGTEALFEPVDRYAAPDMPAFADAHRLSLANDIREPGTRRINQPTFEPHSRQNEIERP